MDEINRIIWRCACESSLVGEKEILTQCLNRLPQNDEKLNVLLKRAVYGNQPNIVEELLKRGAQDTYVDANGNTLLSIAVLLNAQKVVKLLLDSSEARLNKSNALGWTPLHFAAMHRHMKIYELLMKQPSIDKTLLTTTGISVESLLSNNLTEFNQRVVSLFKKGIEGLHQRIALQKLEVDKKENSENRQNLLRRMSFLKLSYDVDKNNKQELLYDVLRLTGYMKDPIEWVEILSNVVTNLLNDDAKVDEEAVRLAIMKRVPILDKMFEGMSPQEKIIIIDNLKDKSGISCLHNVIKYLEENVGKENFKESQAYNWYIATAVQLINAGAKLDTKLSWDQVSSSVRHLIEERLSQNPSYSAIFNSVKSMNVQGDNYCHPLTPSDTESSQSSNFSNFRM